MSVTRALTLFLALALFGFVLLALSAPIARAADPVIVRVTTSGTATWPCGDQSDWSNPCALQTALTRSIPGSELWVASGTYTPTTTEADPRVSTFQLRDGVALYGGFAGGETVRNQRNFTSNVTILSGDLNGNDNGNVQYGEPTRDENSYHVVTAGTGVTNTAVLDGFTVMGGNSNFDGGGIYNSGASLTLSNAILIRNSALEWGGGMLNWNSSPTLSNVTFISNTVNSRGGGMYNENSNPTLTNVTFSGNAAITYTHGYGGGMFNSYSNPVLLSVTFSDNSAYSGGGLRDYFSSSMLNNVDFIANSASYGCGGMSSGGGNPTLRNVTFSGNWAPYAGGMCNGNSSPTLTNVTFFGNWASQWDGGGMLNEEPSNPTLINVTFSGNWANRYGGGMYTWRSSSVTVRNTIFWGNTAPSGSQLGNDDTSTSSLSDSIVQGGCPDSSSTCTHIIPSNPLLGAIGNYGGTTQTIPLLSGSSAIDAGNDAHCPATDQRGVPRPQGLHCDIGAFELEFARLNVPFIKR